MRYQNEIEYIDENEDMGCYYHRKKPKGRRKEKEKVILRSYRLV